MSLYHCEVCGRMATALCCDRCFILIEDEHDEEEALLRVQSERILLMEKDARFSGLQLME